jgi:hypothetical protein
MLTMARIICALWLGLVVLAFEGVSGAFALSERNCTDGSQVNSTMSAEPAVATPQHPAVVIANAGPPIVSHSPALQLTLKATAVNPVSPFLAQVYTKIACRGGAGYGQLLGVVSFFPAKLDAPQEFVLTPPEEGFPSAAPSEILVTVKIIPANPAQDLTHVSVEVLGARFAK